MTKSGFGRWLALSLAILTVMVTMGCGAQGPALETIRGTTPPIIVIVIDTLRADYLGCYGFNGPVSPHLDRFAGESVLFEKCSAQAPWTTPSMASLLTSLYPEAHGVRLGPDDPRDQQTWRLWWTPAIPESTVTLAESLRDRGYRTAAFVSNGFLTGGLGFEQGFETFDESAALSDDRNAATLFDAGLQWLRSLRDAGEPTFLYFHLMDVHGPYIAPEADFEAVRQSPGFGPPVELDRAGFRHIQHYLHSPDWTKGPDRYELRLWRGRYAAGVHAVDRRLGRFVQDLRDSALWDDQLVVVTSDHGEELFDHGGWDHGSSLHEHQVHVPLMIRLPNARLGGTRIGDVVRLVDIMPTITELVGAAAPTEMTGADLLPLMDSPGEAGQQRAAFATSVKDIPNTHSVFDGRFKLISDGAGVMLFDIATDHEERLNLADDRPEIAERLSELLKEELGRVIPGKERTGQPLQISPERLEKLRELGYLQ